MTTILITGIGGDIAQAAAKIIREARPGYVLIGTDIHDHHCGGLFVDESHVLPAAANPGYAAYLDEILSRHSVDIVIPMTEPELSIISASTRPWCRPVQWIHAGAKAIAVGIDKLLTAQTLHGFGIEIPWTLPIAEAGPHAVPCIVKGRFGSGSRSVFVLRHLDDVPYFRRNMPDGIFQELLEPADKEVTCAVFRTSEGEVLTLQLLRTLTGGLTGWAEVIDDTRVTELCRTVANKLDVSGCINIQLRITAYGPRIFEINPRISSTALMRHLLGFQDVVWAIDEAEGKRPSFRAVAPGRQVGRLYGAAVLH